MDYYNPGLGKFWRQLQQSQLDNHHPGLESISWTQIFLFNRIWDTQICFNLFVYTIFKEKMPKNVALLYVVIDTLWWMVIGFYCCCWNGSKAQSFDHVHDQENSMNDPWNWHQIIDPITHSKQYCRRKVVQFCLSSRREQSFLFLLLPLISSCQLQSKVLTSFDCASNLMMICLLATKLATSPMWRKLTCSWALTWEQRWPLHPTSLWFCSSFGPWYRF